MSENQIPLRVSWTANNRRAHGYLHVAPDALHLICLSDESETAARAGQATAQQFGLIGGLIGAGVSAAREAKRKKDLLAVYQGQQTLTLEQRLTQHPLSRTVTKAEVTALKKGPHLAPTLQLASGPLAIEANDPAVNGAIETWAGGHQVKVEFVEPPKFPWKVIGIVFAIPVVLVLVHLLISVPYAIKLMGVQHDALAIRTTFIAAAEQAHGSIGAPVGVPLATACKDVFAGVKPADAMAYVGALPAGSPKSSTRDYEGFPRLAFPEQPYFRGDASKLDTQLVADRWAKPISFGSAYGRVAGSPLEWSRVASRVYGQPVTAPKLSLVGKLQRLTAKGSAARADLTVKVLDDSGKQVCEGDLSLAVPGDSRSSSVGLGFMLSQGIPLGLYLPLCHGERSGPCRDVTSYAALAAE